MRILTAEEREQAADSLDLHITAYGTLGRYRLRFRVLDARAYGVGGTTRGAPDDPFERWFEPTGGDLTIGEMYEALVAFQRGHGPRECNFHFVEAPDFVRAAFHRLVDELEVDRAPWLAMHGATR